MRDEEVTSRVESLRKARVRPERETEMGGMFAERGRELEKLERRIGGVAKAWQKVCPPELLGRTSVQNVVRGVVTIGVEDASTRFELDRVLRSGGEREFVRACPASVRKVKLVSGAIKSDAGASEDD